MLVRSVYVLDSKGTGVQRGRQEVSHGSNGLHAKHKGIFGKIARVRECVLLPPLPEQVSLGAHAVEVVREVAWPRACQYRRFPLVLVGIGPSNLRRRDVSFQLQATRSANRASDLGDTGATCTGQTT